MDFLDSGELSLIYPMHSIIYTNAHYKVSTDDKLISFIAVIKAIYKIEFSLHDQLSKAFSIQSTCVVS